MPKLIDEGGRVGNRGRLDKGLDKARKIAKGKVRLGTSPGSEEFEKDKDGGNVREKWAK
jgi:hypothetical protein